MTSVNNKSNDPMAALGKLFGSMGNEAGSAVNETGKLLTEDVNSVGKAIETGGFIGGALQFLDVTSLGHQSANFADVATGKGALDPRVKEGISAGVNYVSGNPIVLKDLFDLFTAPTTPGVKPSPPQGAVPPPDVDQLRGSGNQPKVPGHPERSGFAEDSVGGVETKSYEVNIVEIKGAHDTLVEYTGTLEQLRNDPEFAARYPEAKYALDQEDWSMAAQSTVIVMSVLRDSPSTVSEIQDVGRQNGVDAPTPALPPAPSAATGQGDFSQAGDQLGGLMKGAMGLLGPAMSFLGPLLQNPAVISAITPLIGAALAAIPGAQVLLPIVPMLPVILPLIGQGMSMAGGAMTAGASGGDPMAAFLGAGPSADGLAGMLGPISGLLGGGAGAPALPVGAAPVTA